jgi:hypothetical protein
MNEARQGGWSVTMTTKPAQSQGADGGHGRAPPTRARHLETWEDLEMASSSF